MKKKLFLLFVLIFSFAVFGYLWEIKNSGSDNVLSIRGDSSYWFVLHRRSNEEFLYFGIAGSRDSSWLVKTFKVKSGVPREKPTPLPQLLGREYWLIVDKFESIDNPETAPYFLTLNIPVGEVEPYGPKPYLECNGQCNWILPGYFGLHGVGGVAERLSDLDLGSSGCVRHSDDDISYLYNLLEPKSGEIRYYIEDI